jgi:hypothetical protein
VLFEVTVNPELVHFNDEIRYLHLYVVIFQDFTQCEAQRRAGKLKST